MSLPSRLLGANPSIQVSTLLSGSLSTPSAKGAFLPDGAELISTQSVAGVNTITFSSLDTYTQFDHLEFHCHLTTTTGLYTRMRFNSDSTSNYTAKGTIATSSGVSNNDYPEGGASNMAPLPRNADISPTGTYITVFVAYFNSTTQRKNYLSRGGGYATATSGQSYVETMGGQWGSTNAITSVELYMNSGSWTTGSKISLYGWANT